MTEDEVFYVDNVEVQLNFREKTNNQYVNAIYFFSDGDKAQQIHDQFLRWLESRIRLDEFVWAYQLEVEVKEKVNLKKALNVPSVLPLIGNVLLTGIILANVKNLEMNQRKFTIVQIDNTVKIVKRDDKYISLMNTLDELGKLIDALQQ